MFTGKALRFLKLQLNRLKVVDIKNGTMNKQIACF